MYLYSARLCTSRIFQRETTRPRERNKLSFLLVGGWLAHVRCSFTWVLGRGLSSPHVFPLRLLPVPRSVFSAFNGAALTTRAKTSSAMKMSFENELGAQAPLGFWDPLYWLEDADQERFDRLRYVEIKHGRICMLAVLGHITQVRLKLRSAIFGESNDLHSHPC